uniref:Putative pentatricopeptide repeat-containing protein At3g01580 n=1 Tax=Anthurium amnicola TaxID=1678845 RepID=A0A1D1XRB3_9ARAE
MVAAGGGCSSGPDQFTLPIALRACTGLSALRHGKALHGYVVRSRREILRSDVFVGTALVEMYATCGEMDSTIVVFEGFMQPDVALWTSVITGYQQNGKAKEAVSFFSRVLSEKKCLIPSPVTMASLISAIAQLGSLACGKCCHGYALRRDFVSDLPLANSLLNMYAKLGGVKHVKMVFAAMLRKDVITWSCMVRFYSQHGNPEEALEHYKRMIDVGFLPNLVTVVSVLQACALSADLQKGRKVLNIKKACD